MTEREAEMQALLTRAAIVEADRQRAVERGDYLAARELELEQSRLHSSYRDLEQGRAA